MNFHVVDYMFSRTCRPQIIDYRLMSISIYRKRPPCIYKRFAVCSGYLIVFMKYNISVQSRFYGSPVKVAFRRVATSVLFLILNSPQSFVTEKSKTKRWSQFTDPFLKEQSHLNYIRCNQSKKICTLLYQKRQSHCSPSA